MKKIIIISLVLAMILGISVYATDQMADHPNVGATEATAGELTDLPTGEIVGIPEPTPTISAVLIRPGKDENWRENAALPETLPDKEISFERITEYFPQMTAEELQEEEIPFKKWLTGVGASQPPFQNALISTREELDVYFEKSVDLSEKRFCSLYEQLQNVDFSQKAVLFFGGTSDNGVVKSVEKIVACENSIIVLLTSSESGHLYNCAITSWGTVVLIDKADLPAEGEDLTIYACTQYYPNWQYENAIRDPSVYPNAVYLPDRYVFREIAE